MVPVTIGCGVTDKASGVGAISPAPHIADVGQPDPVVRQLPSGCNQGGASKSDGTLCQLLAGAACSSHMQMAAGMIQHVSCWLVTSCWLQQPLADANRQQVYANVSGGHGVSRLVHPAAPCSKR